MKRIQTFLARFGAGDPLPPWSLTGALLTVLVAFAAMLIGSAVALVWGGTQDFVELAGWTLGGLLILLYVWQTRQRDRDALRLNTASTPILFVMFVSLGCAIALDLISNAVTGEFQPKPELLGLNPGTLGIAEWGFAVIFMVVVQPIAEGLVFRGIALPALRGVLGAWGGLIAAALLAGAFHLLVYPPNYATASSITPIWFGLVIPFVEAVLYTGVRGYTQSTRAAIAAQMAFGLFAVIKLLSLTGAPL